MNFSDPDIEYMQRCLQLAALGSPNVAPNPMVGSVIVCDGKIIGEGYHQKFGDAHAEVNAIGSVQDLSLLQKSTLYVSLEPCSHTGKTPPCCNLIITHQIPKVVCAMLDPNPLVAGRGIEKLSAAGVEIKLNVLQKEAENLNRAFITFHRYQRPFIVLKWARTSDGFMGRLPSEFTKTKKISNPTSDLFVHKLRSESRGIIIGSGTAQTDNPSLTTRLWAGENPVRIIFDSAGSVDANSVIFTDGNRTVVFGNKPPSAKNAEFVEIDSNDSMIPKMLDWCFQEGINQILVEGGAFTLNKFIESGHWDEAFEIVSSEVWGDGILAPTLNRVAKTFQLGTDTVYHHQKNIR